METQLFKQAFQSTPMSTHFDTPGVGVQHIAAANGRGRQCRYRQVVFGQQRLDMEQSRSAEACGFIKNYNFFLDSFW